MFPLLRKWFPMARNENMTTERKTGGDKPEITAKIANDIKMEINFIKDPFRLFGIGFRIKFINSIINPT